MRHVFIGDLHGRSIWNTIDPKEFDKIIFMGDYVDDYDASDDVIVNNLLNIIEFKKSYTSKVILLLGNHDTQYFCRSSCICSGYRQSYAPVMKLIFDGNKDLFSLSYEHGDVLCTHAGICMGWYKYKYLPHIATKYPLEISISECLNEAFMSGNYDIFDIGMRRGGGEMVGGPLWSDKHELLKLPDFGYRQVVGHNQVECVKKMNDDRITFVDCNWNHENVLNTMDNFHVLDIY